MYINVAIIDKQFLQSIKYYGILRRCNWSMPYCLNLMRNLCDAALISREVAALPFQVHASNGIWLIDFDCVLSKS